MPGAQQTIYRSRTPAPALPQQSVWDYLFDGVAFDDARLVYAECQGAQRRISCVVRGRALLSTLEG